ncbi:45809_t:CDS:2, partial [Gigaspora margarita]
DKKNQRKVLDCIKKDLEKLANLDDFDMARKRKAQAILDDWKSKILPRQKNTNTSLLEHQETINTEGTSTRKGEPSSAGMRLREKRNSEYQDKPKKIKTNKEMKISSSSLAGSLSSSQSSIIQQTPNLVTDNDEVEQMQMSEGDFNKFTKVFQKLENTKKWVLISRKVVEDELYKFGMRYNYK